MRRAPLFAVLLLLGLGACRPASAPASTAAGKPDAAAVPAAAAAPAAGAAAAAVATEAPAPVLGEFKIVAVDLGKAVDGEHRVTEAQQVFAPGDTLYAAITSLGPHPGLTLSARWVRSDGTLVAETQQPLVPTSPTITTFSVKDPDGWPTGGYRLEIAIDGHVENTQNFLVQ